MPAIHQKTNVVAFYGRHRLRRYSLLLLAIIVVLAVYRVTILSVQRSFDTDEFEHIQDAWLISQGFSIYRDFFEHHPPLLYLFLAPLFAFFDESEALFIARMSMVPFAVGILAMTYLIAAKIRGRLAGIIAGALLSTLVVFQQKSIEIRPDVPAVFFLLLAFYCSFTSKPGPLHLAGAGMAYGVALLCTPKLVFTLPAFAAVMTHAEHKSVLHWRACKWMTAGFLLPLGLVAAYLYLHDTLEQAVFFNVSFNMAVPFTYHWDTLYETVGPSFTENWFLWCLALFSVAASTARAMRKIRKSGTRWQNESIITCASMGVGLGLFMIPVPSPQYLMSLGVVLSILVGIYGAGVVCALMKLCPSTPSCVLMLALITGIFLHPVPTLLRARLASNGPQLRALRYEWESVPADECVFDCWAGAGVFRRPAFFYHFLGPDIMLTLERLDQRILRDFLLKTLKEKRPLAITNDQMLHALPDNVNDYINANYHADRYGLLLLRNASEKDRVGAAAAVP